MEMLGLINKFEEYFGKAYTRLVLFAVTLAILTFAASTIYFYVSAVLSQLSAGGTEGLILLSAWLKISGFILSIVFLAMAFYMWRHLRKVFDIVVKNAEKEK